MATSSLEKRIQALEARRALRNPDRREGRPETYSDEELEAITQAGPPGDGWKLTLVPGASFDEKLGAIDAAMKGGPPLSPEATHDAREWVAMYRKPVAGGPNGRGWRPLADRCMMAP